MLLQKQITINKLNYLSFIFLSFYLKIALNKKILKKN